MRNTYIGVLAIIEMIKTLSALAWARVGALFLTLQSLGDTFPSATVELAFTMNTTMSPYECLLILHGYIPTSSQLQTRALSQAICNTTGRF